MNVHPAAALFPMLTDEEIDQLAEDIKANGLLHPIIMDGETLIPGGNQGTTIVRVWMLEYDDLKMFLVGKLRFAKNDIAAVREDLRRWAEYNGTKIDVDVEMDSILKVAGL